MICTLQSFLLSSVRSGKSVGEQKRKRESCSKHELSSINKVLRFLHAKSKASVILLFDKESSFFVLLFSYTHFFLVYQSVTGAFVYLCLGMFCFLPSIVCVCVSFRFVFFSREINLMAFVIMSLVRQRK